MNRFDLPHSDPRPHLVKSKPVDDVPFVRAWRDRHFFCAACGRSGPITVHHIIGGRGGRSDEACNLLALCWEPCHLLAEGMDIIRGLPKITTGIALSMKQRVDPAEFDLERCQVLNGRQLLELEPIPAWAETLFRRNRPEFFQCP